jgi:cytochrome c-type biogenesis protein CcmH
MTDTVTALRQQLQQLRELHASGVLNDTQYAESRAPLERKLADLVLAGADPGAVAAEAPTQSNPLKWAGLGGLAVVLAVAGYWWTGSPRNAGLAPAASPPVAAADPAASAPHALGSDEITAMTERLAARLKDRPDDAEGWSMLGRSYMALGRFPEAKAAYERVLKLAPNDATSLADYADVLAVTNDRKLEGEPLKLIERALKLDPDNLKALTLAGTAAFRRGEYARAVDYWDHAVRVGPADSTMVESARNGAAEAREIGKLPPPPADVAAKAQPPLFADLPAPPPPAAPAPVAGASVSGTVSLAPDLKGKVAPEDTVFIFARPAEGSRMPLAILRKQVKDLPFEFTLDDSLAMSPAARISSAGQVVVGARVSKSGQAMPQPGDFEGLSTPTAVGARGLAIVIATPSK